MVLGRLPAKDQSLEPNEPLDSARPAVLSSFPEPGLSVLDRGTQLLRRPWKFW
jgi:hypothetical protein